VALLEARMSSELATLIERAGGVPYSVPAVREAPLDAREAVEAFLNGLARDEFSIVIFLTGVGAKALFAEAERLGRLPELLAALTKVTTVCRGPKPVAVLKRNGVPISLTAREPHTTSELLETLAGVELAGKGVALLHYGERNATLADALRSAGAQLTELCLYEWLLPENLAPLQALVHQLVGGQVDVIAFTSQIQVRHLFQTAQSLGQSAELLKALHTKVVVASVGPTCTATLLEFGASPAVVPEHPKMGHLVTALVDYVERNQPPDKA
jgi:uroporphyrinogen-III synthase